jgi:hypothetical protein
MFFGLTSPCTSARLVGRCHRRQPLERHCAVGVRAGGREQVRLEADRVEDGVRRELRSGGGVGRGGGVDAREPPRHFGREARVGVASRRRSFHGA